MTFAPWWRNNTEYNKWVKMYLNLCSYKRQASSYLSVLSWKISRFWVLIAVWIMMDWPLRGKKQYPISNIQYPNSSMTKKWYHSFSLGIDGDGVFAKRHSQKLNRTTPAVLQQWKSWPKTSLVYLMELPFTVLNKTKKAPYKEVHEPNAN